MSYASNYKENWRVAYLLKEFREWHTGFDTDQMRKKLAR